MTQWLQAKDTISGQQGRLYATINGNVEEMAYCKKFEAKIEKNMTEVKVLGYLGDQNKANGWKGTGSMTFYYVTSLFRQMMLDYVTTGKDTYFDLVAVNEDPTSSIGKQTVTLKNVNISSIIIAKLDTESQLLDEDLDFTFSGVGLQDSFSKPVLGGN
ncbi:phage tail tube protein [Paenibacillus kribbensis]|uniref:phage tail tube protein n=1 Tax=Paenibacillus kribbensis TaxID=172713 RepID=UPI0008399284|nr:phage tail tube protein [Paenibacillus kribbensis]